MTGIGQKIKKIRELRNYTQEYMAGRLAMSQVNYSRIERDEINLKPEKLEQIAEILDVEKEQLLAFDEKVVFNIMHNQAPNNILYRDNTIIYQIDPKLESLYEDKIRLLEEKVKWLEGKGKPV